MATTDAAINALNSIRISIDSALPVATTAGSRT